MIPATSFWKLENYKFEFVLCFVLRISDLRCLINLVKLSRCLSWATFSKQSIAINIVFYLDISTRWNASPNSNSSSLAISWQRCLNQTSGSGFSISCIWLWWLRTSPWCRFDNWLPRPPRTTPLLLYGVLSPLLKDPGMRDGPWHMGKQHPA